MRKVISWAALALFVLGVTVAPVSAQDKPKPEPEAVFKKLDTNGDGKLDKTEFVGKKTGDAATKAETAFGKLDKNGDGSLSLEEFKAAGKKKDK